MVGVLLAAGMSTRMGNVNKLLLTLEGESIISKSINNIRNSQINNILVVLGHEMKQVAAQLPKDGITPILNPDYKKGLVYSLASVLPFLESKWESIYIFLADMPYLDSQSINEFIHFCTDAPQNIIRPKNQNGRPGHPVHIPTKIFKNLKFTADQKSLKPLLMAHSDIFIDYQTDKNVYFRDIDTFQDYFKL